MEAIDNMKHDDVTTGREVELETSHKSQLQALLSHCHELFHKKGGGIAVNGPAHTQAEFKTFCTTSCDPTECIVPWWKLIIQSEGLSNWNKSTKPNAHDWKHFREMSA